MKTYLVGGAVRDGLLDLPVTERDWVVVGETPATMCAQGFRQIDADFPVFQHPETGEEYALARQESKTGTGYRGFAVDANPNITLQQDLARRDLTINAIAQDGNGRLIDPFNGQDDIQAGYLRHVSPAFGEDPVRLLRIARFAAKLGHCGFRVAHKTHHLMQQMVADGAAAELKPERIWQEMKKALNYQQPWRFFEVLNACGALSGLLPGLAGTMPDKPHQANQPSPAINALRQACKFSDEATVRFSALSLTMEIPEWLNNTSEKRFARLLIEAKKAWAALHHLDGQNAEQLYAFLQQHRAWHSAGRFIDIVQILQAQAKHADLLDKIVQAQKICAATHAGPLKSQGLAGPALGQALAQQRIELIQAHVTS